MSTFYRALQVVMACAFILTAFIVYMASQLVPTPFEYVGFLASSTASMIAGHLAWECLCEATTEEKA